jgi:hypothetical protein
MTQTHRQRLFALVGTVLMNERKATHTAGYPLDPTKMLPLADVVLVIEDDESNAMAFRYTVHGDAGGDTLHDTVTAAKEHLAEEYGEALSPWFTVPPEIVDPHAFVIGYAADQFSGR